jgi:hypothetical protein
MIEPTKHSSNSGSIQSFVSNGASTPVAQVQPVVKLQQQASLLQQQQSQQIAQQQPHISQFEITSISCSVEEKEKKESRFRRVKIDTTTKYYKKGRWNITDSYDDSDSKTTEINEQSKTTLPNQHANRM